ncbi:hypothetical protein OsJ_28168 [Oryza sativa Japonica Group]|uniref:Ubiquitin-like domain-containing protein n=1 Tax=Oryza sativa subsp. japonica TaxID=39947 RepID=A3BVF7_ORYSJ|nr:hypothetical protein OsJ_28168 [Oryza sativa Japonica Group]
MKKETAAVAKEEVWEVRPGGMLVQKRSPESEPPPGGAPVPTIRVKVKYNGVYHEIYINSQASFGELKKLLSEKTGLHPDDQKVVYRDKERDSKAFLDIAGVKDRSKMLLLEDPTAQAKRLLEERRHCKAERAAKSVSRVALDVDKLASKVSALEAIVSKGGRVVDADVVALTEALMNELVKLDSIAADGEVKEQRRVQEKRVQKYRRGPRRHPCQDQESRGGAAQGPAAHLPPRAAAGAAAAAPAVPAAGARHGDRAGATDRDGQLGVVRPALIRAVHVVGPGDHHGAGDHHHHLAVAEVRVGALLDDVGPTLAACV